MMEVRKSEDRGHVKHDWLDSYHSFSFASYHDPQHMGFGPLRVINEDWIHPTTGFGIHGHSNMEIVTYVLEGELAHQDSLGTGSVIRAGNVQRMSAGKGIQHSEHNSSQTDKAHLLQIWIQPSQFDLAPEYEEKYFSSEEKSGRLRLIVSPDGGSGSMRIHQDAKLYAGLFDGMQTASLSLAQNRMAYVQLVRGSLLVNGTHLSAGDALKLREEVEVRLQGGQQAEVLVFDLPSRR